MGIEAGGGVPIAGGGTEKKKTKITPFIKDHFLCPEATLSAKVTDDEAREAKLKFETTPLVEAVKFTGRRSVEITGRFKGGEDVAAGDNL